MENLLTQLKTLKGSFETIQDIFKNNPELETIQFTYSTFCDDGMMLLDIDNVFINGEPVEEGDWNNTSNPNILKVDDANWLEGAISTLLIETEGTEESEMTITREILNIEI